MYQCLGTFPPTFYIISNFYCTGRWHFLSSFLKPSVDYQRRYYCINRHLLVQTTSTQHKETKECKSNKNEIKPMNEIKTVTSSYDVFLSTTHSTTPLFQIIRQPQRFFLMDSDPVKKKFLQINRVQRCPTCSSYRVVGDVDHSRVRRRRAPPSTSHRIHTSIVSHSLLRSSPTHSPRKFVGRECRGLLCPSWVGTSFHN